MLEQRVYEILTKSGWNEGRKIDITKQITVLENNDYKVFDVAKRFIEEFGELSITPKYIDFFNEEDYDEHTTHLEDIRYYYEKKENYDENVGESTIPVCKLYTGEYVVCISESGKFFIDQGMIAENTEDFWNGVLGEYKFGFLNWKDYMMGKDLSSIKRCKNELYY